MSMRHGQGRTDILFCIVAIVGLLALTADQALGQAACAPCCSCCGSSPCCGGRLGGLFGNGCRYDPCRCGPCVRVPSEGAIQPKPDGVGEEPGVTPGEPGAGEPYTPSTDAMAGAFGAPTGPSPTGLNMIGDNFGGSFYSVQFPLQPQRLGGDQFDGFYPTGPVAAAPQATSVCASCVIPSPGRGGPVGQLKIAENTSPFPQDRLIFDYTYFDDVNMLMGGVNVSRFVAGFEKTFFDGMMSFEVKAPMAVTMDSTLLADDFTDLTHGEFGNLALTYKSLVIQADPWTLSMGMTVALPTADDVSVGFSDGTDFIQVRNEGVHLMPFLGFHWQPGDRFFAHGFVQWDVDTGGNPVLLDLGRGLEEVGRVQDATFQFTDVGVGYWLRPHGHHHGGVRAAALTAELHWNRSLQESDSLFVGGFGVGGIFTEYESLNATFGLHLFVRERTTLTFGYTAPLMHGADRPYDGEVRVMLNHNFGRQDMRRWVPL